MSPVVRTKDRAPKAGRYYHRFWSLPPGEAKCYNPTTMHRMPDKTQTWRIWGIYIPLSGQFSTDHELLRAALLAITDRQESSSTDRIRTGADPPSSYPGGLHYRFWARDEDIEKGREWLIKIARGMIDLDYHIDYMNFLSWEVYCSKEEQREREGRGDDRPTPYPKMYPSRQVKYPWL